MTVNISDLGTKASTQDRTNQTSADSWEINEPEVSAK